MRQLCSTRRVTTNGENKMSGVEGHIPRCQSCPWKHTRRRGSGAGRAPNPAPLPRARPAGRSGTYEPWRRSPVPPPRCFLTQGLKNKMPPVADSCSAPGCFPLGPRVRRPPRPPPSAHRSPCTAGVAPMLSLLPAALVEYKQRRAISARRTFPIAVECPLDRQGVQQRGSKG